jgi:uncharacterized protein YjbI with pentapeptide repeats
VANEEHVKRLKQGVTEWNSWRSEFVIPDLSEARLAYADLSHHYLRRAHLAGVDLRGANLRAADLRSTNLRAAKLNEAFLNGAHLGDASLIRANLNGAVLHRTDLRRVTLRNANLYGADLTNAILYETVFANVDLTGVIGLEACNHVGPSIIDYRTLQKSGRLPLSFLRGVGLQDRLIEYLPSLLKEAIQYYSCFISYSSKDQDFADRIHADLQNNGVRCWFAPHDMKIGDKILDAIDDAIRLRDKVLLILSEHSIKSDWVEDEVSKSFAEERKRGQPVLFPIRVDNTVMDTNEAWALKLRDQRNIGDFRNWKDHDGYKKIFDRVLRDLRRASG